MTVDYTQFDAETYVPGQQQYISPTWDRSDDEADIAQELAVGFIAAVVILKGNDIWSALSKKWSERGFKDDDLSPLHKSLVGALKSRLGDALVRAAGLGREQALADFEAAFPAKDWRAAATTWSQVYGNEMASQIADQTNKGLSSVIPTLINKGLRGDALANQVKVFYGLDPRSTTSVMNFLDRKEKPRNKTALDVAQEFLTRRANVIGDVQSFTGLNFGRQMTYMEAMDAGLMPKSARKVWVTAIDERVCKVCRPMDGVTVHMLDTFNIPTGDGKVRLLVPPVHPNCRCTVVPEERYRHGIITRRARFRDEGPSHRSRLRSEIEDLVSLGKAASEASRQEGERPEEVVKFSWEEIRHPRDKSGKFTDEAKHAAELAALGGLTAATLLHPAIRTRLNIMRVPAKAEAWANMPSMKHFPANVQLIRMNNPEVNQQIGLLHDLNSEEHWGHHVLFHPNAYKHLEGKNAAETLQNVEEFIRSKTLEHSAVITPQGRILSMGRGSDGTAPVWLPTLMPKRAAGNLLFTHNHPDAGVEKHVLHTLSGQDVIALHQHGIGRARAVAPNGNFFDIQINPDAPKEAMQQFAEMAGPHALVGQDEAVVSMLQSHFGYSEERAEAILEEFYEHEAAAAIGVQTDFGPPTLETMINGAMAGHQAQRMHELYQDMAETNPELMRYNFGRHQFVEKFSPMQARDALGRFAPLIGAGVAAGVGAAALTFPVKDPSPTLPRHLRRVDRKVKSVKSGTYIVPRQYLDFHVRGMSYRMGNEAHITDMARQMRTSGYRFEPVSLNVYDDAVDVADGNHRVEAAYRAKVGLIPAKINRIPGKKPKRRGVGHYLAQRQTNEARQMAASRYVGHLEDAKPNPFRRLNQRLIAQDERRQRARYSWDDKSRRRSIKPL